jgi:ABC-type spermidine/putrescine transport system permease subunit II
MFTPKVVDVVAFLVMFNGVRIVINYGLHNGFITVIFSNMVVAIPSPSYRIFIAFTYVNRETTINKVDASVAFINQDKNIVQL